MADYDNVKCIKFEKGLEGHDKKAKAKKAKKKKKSRGKG